MNGDRHFRASPRTLALTLVLALAACATPPKPEIASGAAQDARSPAADHPMPGALASAQRLITVQSPEVKAYRKFGAGRIYQHYPKRIYHYSAM